MSLTLSDIHLKRGAKTILDNASIAPLQSGAFTVLAGPNGAGKSSLLRAVAQTLPYKGEISLNGEDLTKMRAAKRAERLGYMPQNLHSASDLSVIDSVLVAMNAAARSPLADHDQLARAQDLMVQFDCVSLAERPLSTLSGGQRQSVGLVQALARDPQLLLLDEPTAALDLAMQFRLLSQVARIAHEGRTVIAVLHDLTQAARWADRIIMLNDGAIAADGTPSDVLTPEVLRAVYRIEARVELDTQGHRLICVDGTL